MPETSGPDQTPADCQYQRVAGGIERNAVDESIAERAGEVATKECMFALSPNSPCNADGCAIPAQSKQFDAGS